MAVPERNGPGGSRPTAAEARAAAEAVRDERRGARDRRLSEAFGDSAPGRPVRVVSWSSTAVLAGVSLVTLLDHGLLGVYFVVTFSMFVLGAALLALDVVLAMARSTTHSMGIGGLFFAVDSAPRGVAVSLNASLGCAVLVALVTAIVGISTPELAFGTLSPLLQVALTGLWTVRHGLFPARGADAGGDGVG